MSPELISTLLPIVVIGLIGLVVGALVGFLLAGLANPATPPEAKNNQAQIEVARLWRERRGGNLSIEMAGKRLKSAAELSAAQRDALAQAVDELQLWLSAEDVVERLLGSKAEAAVAPLPDPSPLAPPSPQPASPALPEVLLASEPEVKPPSLELRDILSRAFTVPDKTKSAPRVGKSIAAQVDEIIQEKLPNSPFKNHLITMSDLPGAGLVVKVDDARYEGVGEVPDPEIRAFIRECVTEWELRAEDRQHNL